MFCKHIKLFLLCLRIREFKIHPRLLAHLKARDLPAKASSLRPPLDGELFDYRGGLCIDLGERVISIITKWRRDCLPESSEPESLLGE